MNLVIVIIGLLFLIGVALLIGSVQARAREDAWRRIADARRDHHAPTVGPLSTVVQTTTRS